MNTLKEKYDYTLNQYRVLFSELFRNYPVQEKIRILNRLSFLNTKLDVLLNEMRKEKTYVESCSGLSSSIFCSNSYDCKMDGGNNKSGKQDSREIKRKK